MIRIFIILLFTALYAHAQDVSQEEQDLYLATIKAQDVDRQITESDQFKACRDKPNQKEIEKCINDKMKDVDPKELADKLDLGSFDKKASKDEKSLRAYLGKRIHKAVYGVDLDDEKVKQAKLVDHALWSKLYRSQIGKNILMEISNYCLVNLGFKDDPYAVVNHCSITTPIDKNNKPTKDPDEVKSFALSSCKAEKITKNDGTGVSYSGDSGKSITFKAGSGHKDENENRIFDYELFDLYSSSITTSASWESLKEYTLHEQCSNKDASQFCIKKVVKPDGTEGNIRVRNASFIKAVKEIEFKLGPDYLRAKYQFCSFTAIKNMCELYKCRNVYDSDTKSAAPDKIKYCNKVLGLNLTYDTPRKDDPITDPTDDLSTGSIACGVVDKLKEYKKMIAALDTIDEQNKGLKVKTGFHASMYKPGFYGSGNKEGELSVEQITNISSTEISKEVDHGLTEEEAKELRDECIAPDGSSIVDDEKCKGLVTDLSDEDESIVVAELEAETKAYLKRLEMMKDDDESIKEYLIKNGLSKYIDEVGKDNDLLVTLIRDEYKSKRAALKKRMMEKFNQIRSKNSSGNSSQDIAQQEAQIATESLASLEKQKEKIQTLFQYNNVISSYMSAQLGEGEDAEKTDLSYIRQYELEGMSGEFGDEETKAQYEDYSQNFEDDNARSASGNEQMNVDLGFIDSLLGEN